VPIKEGNGEGNTMTIDIVDTGKAGQAHAPSYWAETAGTEIVDAAPVNAAMDVDIAIIGGGYTGLSTAYHLARDFGLRAHVLEANRIGWGCSGRNGGFVSIGMGKTGPADWTRRWSIDAARRIFDQSRDAVRLVKTLLREEGIDAQATADGGLELAHKANRVKELAAAATRMARDFGFTAQLLDKTALETSYLHSREAYGALLYPEGFALHPLLYARGLARAAQKRGAFLHAASPVTSWGRDGARHLLKTPGGTVRARQVVIACNGYTGDRLHPMTAGRLLPVLSNIVVTRPLTGAERAAVNWRTHLKIWDTRHLLFYYRLLPEGRILFGARGGIEDTPESRADRRRWMERRLGEMFPELAGIETTHFWNGWVCVTRDKNPHLGSVENGSVHFALGCIGSGVALLSYCGKLLAHRLAGDTSLAPNALLETPLPGFPLPVLRRLYQRTMYGLFEIEDRWL